MAYKTETKVGAFVVIAIGILFYMSFFLGVFRWDRARYHLYTVYFDDVSGLEKKAEVKIAGVKVGWVDRVELVDSDYQAKAYVMILKRCVLRKNASAIVRQDGILGTKFLEIIPGDPRLPELLPHEPLGRPGKTPTSIDDILHRVGDIATNVEGVTDSFQDLFASQDGRQQLKSILSNLAVASERMANFTQSLDKTLSRNEDTINAILSDFRDIAGEVKDRIPSLGNDIHRLTDRIDADLIPSLRSNMERISDVLDRDFNRFATKFEGTSGSFEAALKEARGGLRSFNSVAQKVDEGKGLIGKLINEEETYRDLKMAISGIKNYIARVEALEIVFDSHGEYMMNQAENCNFKDAKGYFDIRVHPNDDYFMLVSLLSSQKGKLKRTINDKVWFDELGQPFYPRAIVDSGRFLPELIGTIETTERTLDQFKFGFQFGKIFKDVALRFGMFENTAGAAVDVDIPFNTDKFRWVTTFEIFDVRGRDRIDDSRPHLKWLNRVFLFRNIYMAFGADDFISRYNANGFMGGGVRFNDDDIKYLASKIGFASFGA